MKTRRKKMDPTIKMLIGFFLAYLFAKTLANVQG